MPVRDDRLAVYVQGQGYSVGLKGEVLEIREKGKAVSEARLMEISQLSLFGNVQLTAQALRELAAREVPIVHLSNGGWLHAVTTPPPHKNIELHRRQFAAAGDQAGCVRLARAFVAGKIRNTRTLLRRNARDLPVGVLYQLAICAVALAMPSHWSNCLASKAPQPGNTSCTLPTCLSQEMMKRAGFCLYLSQPPPSTRSGECTPVISLCLAHERDDRHAGGCGLRPVPGVLSSATLWTPCLGP